MLAARKDSNFFSLKLANLCVIFEIAFKTYQKTFIKYFKFQNFHDAIQKLLHGQKPFFCDFQMNYLGLISVQCGINCEHIIS